MIPFMTEPLTLVTSKEEFLLLKEAGVSFYKKNPIRGVHGKLKRYIPSSPLYVSRKDMVTSGNKLGRTMYG